MHRLRGAFFLSTALTFLFVIGSQGAESTLGLPARQMVVCIAPERSSYEGMLQLCERDAKGDWQRVGDPWPVLFARNGLAWGRGLNPSQDGAQKVSDDGRNPAGLFQIGYAMGYSPHPPPGSRGWPYHQVTERDAWIDEPSLPGYNHLYTLDPGARKPAWWDKEHLHLGDAAYEWMLVIQHNYNQAIANDGTEIFFHVRRGEHYRTAGCTTMAKPDLVRMICWLRPDSDPMLAELSRSDYKHFWRAWHLPSPDVLGEAMFHSAPEPTRP